MRGAPLTILAVLALVVAWWVGRGLAMEYLTSWTQALWDGGWQIPMVLLSLVIGLGLANFSARPGRMLLMTAGAYLLGSTLAWGWVRCDDFVFARQAAERGAGHHRSRWFPYSEIGLEQDAAGAPTVLP